jgi:hypothetical protein
MSTTSFGNGNTFDTGTSPLVTPHEIETANSTDELKTQSIDFELWAASQSLALAKLKVFHQMAKSVNDTAGQ